MYRRGPYGAQKKSLPPPPPPAFEIPGGADERLRCVAVVDERLERAFGEHEVFFSPLLMMIGDDIRGRSTYIAREAELLGLSLTFATKRVGAPSLRWRRGDLRSETDRRGWPIGWRTDSPTLARAFDDMAGIPQTQLRHRSAARIIDRRPDLDAPPPLRPGERLASRELPGGLRRSAPGRILSVR